MNLSLEIAGVWRWRVVMIARCQICDAVMICTVDPSVLIPMFGWLPSIVQAWGGRAHRGKH